MKIVKLNLTRGGGGGGGVHDSLHLEGIVWEEEALLISLFHLQIHVTFFKC